MIELPSPRVFISYAHESDAHKASVRALADRLRQGGIDVALDQYEENDPPFWPAWMEREIERADYVICVVSPRYRERWEGRSSAEAGGGVAWEGALISASLYRSLYDAQRRVIAVVFDANLIGSIPLTLFPTARTHYVLDRDYEQLYRRLTRQAVVERPPLGPVRRLHTEPTGPEIADSGGGERRAVQMLGRPGFDVTEFRDRICETRQVVSACTRPGREVILLAGRAGIGKTGLLGRAFRLIEEESTLPLTIQYLDAGGPVPISADLLRAVVTMAMDRRVVADARLLIAVDHSEALFSRNGERWRSPRIRATLRELYRTAIDKLVLVTRVSPHISLLPDAPKLALRLVDGLPRDDAVDLLWTFDSTGELGLRGNRAVSVELVALLGGEPRRLELAVASLIDDPLLTPEVLIEQLNAHPERGRFLLRECYRALSEPQRAVLSALALGDGGMDLERLYRVVDLERRTVAEAVRSLARRHLLKIDRLGGCISMDRMDARLFLDAFVAQNQRAPLHKRIADVLQREVDSDCGSDARDITALTAVRHLFDAGAFGEAADLLDRYEAEFLQVHGLYDQLISLRERLMTHLAPALQYESRRRLLRLYSLAGNAKEVLMTLRKLDEQRSEGSPVDIDLEIEAGFVLTDLGAIADGFKRLKGLRAAKLTPQQRLRFNTGVAQIARRAGLRSISDRQLRTALAVVGSTEPVYPGEAQARALAVHHLAVNARLGDEHELALELLEEASDLSLRWEDRGGAVYRQCLQAALLVDALAFSQAHTLLLDAVHAYSDINDRWGLSAAAFALACVQADLGDVQAAGQSLILAETNASHCRNHRVVEQSVLARAWLSFRSGQRVEFVRIGSAIRRLRAHGLTFYADRLERECAVLRWLTGRGPLPASRLRRDGQVGKLDEPHFRALSLLRPLSRGSEMSTADLPPGLQHDVRIALERLS